MNKKIFEVPVVKIVVVTIAILILIAPSLINIFTRTTYTAVVTDKAIKRYSDSDVYLIYTDIGTFKNTDELMFGKFNSSDIYGRIIVGNAYEITTVGVRIPFFSAYPNIIEVKPVSGGV